MAKQLFLNNFEVQFIDAVKDTATTGTPATELNYGILRLNSSASGVLVNPTGGDYYLLTALKRAGSVESNIEIMKVTAVDNSTYQGECRITVSRAQEETISQAYVTGDYISLRWTKGGAETAVQRDATETLTNKTLTTPVINGFSGTGNGTVTGNLTVSGNTTLGDSAADTVTIPGPLSVGSLNGGPLAGFRNRIINGGFAVNQRAVSGTVVLGAGVLGVGVYGHDRFKGGASGCTYTFSTSNNVTTLTISAGSLQQVIEGANLDTGTYCLSWTGTSTGKIGAGAYSASGVTGSITGGTNTTIEFSTGTLARPQLTPGTVATPFEFRPYSVELALCQRYYFRITPTENYRMFGLAAALSTTFAGVIIPFPVPLLAVPSALEQSGTAGDYAVSFAGTNTVCTLIPSIAAATTIYAAQVNFNTGATLTPGQAGKGILNGTTSAFLGFRAEL